MLLVIIGIMTAGYDHSLVLHPLTHCRRSIGVTR
jgi:hypothetical protein